MPAQAGIQFWIPAFAGMTNYVPGMTNYFPDDETSYSLSSSRNFASMRLYVRERAFTESGWNGL
jgi:hypothetical protein